MRGNDNDDYSYVQIERIWLVPCQYVCIRVSDIVLSFASLGINIEKIKLRLCITRMQRFRERKRKEITRKDASEYSRKCVKMCRWCQFMRSFRSVVHVDGRCGIFWYFILTYERRCCFGVEKCSRRDFLFHFVFFYFSRKK